MDANSSFSATLLQNVDIAFCNALPKVELHAHLSGSISRDFLHQTWARKQAAGQCLDLQDPLVTIRPEGVYHDISTFFELFGGYIHRLFDDREGVKRATHHVLQSFQDDGVAYLELRTTPRMSANMTAEAYILAVQEAIADFRGTIRVNMILSIDRSMSAKQADQIVGLAMKYMYGSVPHAVVVGVDLCGNPAMGEVSKYRAAFAQAKAKGLKVTLHFAEIPASSSNSELETLLSFEPDRLGHVINVPQSVKDEIEQRRLALELCLSCNVLAKMTDRDYARHHFGEWRRTACPIALSTDDVGIFDSPQSNEYLLAATHFSLGKTELVALSRQAVEAMFGSDSEKEHVRKLLDEFEDKPSV